MEIGAVVLATDQGLGHLARAFFDNGVFTRVLIEPHLRRPSHPHWYPEAQRYDPARAEEFLHGLDVLLILEQTRQWPLVEAARARGIAVALMPMYECTPNPLPVEADVYICPSHLDYLYYAHKRLVRRLPVPVNVPWRRRRRARLFVHNSGNAPSAFRNGTMELLAALPLIRSPFKLILRRLEDYLAWSRAAPRQPEIERLLDNALSDPRVEFVDQAVPFEDLWREGDAFVFPESYNGLSLPLQEAHAAGMLVIATDRFPVNTWLPREPLVPPARYTRCDEFGVPCWRAEVTPDAVAAAVDRWYGRDIEAYSLAGRDWAQAHGWAQWTPVYRQTLEDCARRQSNRPSVPAETKPGRSTRPRHGLHRGLV